MVAGELLDDGTRRTHRPEVGHGEGGDHAGSLVTDVEKRILEGHFFLSIGLRSVYLHHLLVRAIEIIEIIEIIWKKW